MTTVKHHCLGAAAAALAFGFALTSANAAGLFTLSSTTFADGKIMPKKVANTMPQPQSELRRRKRLAAVFVEQCA